MVSSSVLAAILATIVLAALFIPTISSSEDVAAERLSGAEPISFEKYRYFTAITSRTGNFLCSGVLVGRRHVATADYCVIEPIAAISVDVGYYCERRDNCGRPHQVIAVARAAFGENQLAILTLEEAPSILPEINPILPDLDGKILKKLKSKAKMTFVGGGRHAEGSGPSEFVAELTVRYIPLKKCKKSDLTRDLFGMICSKPVGEGFAGPCAGDGGAPVIVKRKGVEYLVAVHIFGKRICDSKRVLPDGHASVKKATQLFRVVMCGGTDPEEWC